MSTNNVTAEEMGGNAINPQPKDTTEEVEDEVDPEEYQMLDAKLDDLNTVLDMIEQKNDKLQSECMKLLHSNKQIREEIKQENMQILSQSMDQSNISTSNSEMKD